MLLTDWGGGETVILAAGLVLAAGGDGVVGETPGAAFGDGDSRTAVPVAAAGGS